MFCLRSSSYFIWFILCNTDTFSVQKFLLEIETFQDRMMNIISDCNLKTVATLINEKCHSFIPSVENLYFNTSKHLVQRVMYREEEIEENQNSVVVN